MMIKNLLKILSYNLAFGLIAILSIEIVFGGWFKKDNLGAYFREHRMKKVPYSIQYQGEVYDYIYLRNYNGFIGDEIDPKDIKYVFIGGSTADERWKPRKMSIIEQVNKKFKEDSIDIKIINAGIEGQSTIGYIANFKFWFPKLKEFKPKYLIFYTGINELLRKDFNTFNYTDGYAKLVEDNKKSYLKDFIKTKSIFYDLARKTKHKYYTREKKIFMNIDKLIKKYPENSAFTEQFNGKYYDYLNFNQALKEVDIDKIMEQEKEFTSFYLKNIDTIATYSLKLGAKPIFINQVTAFGGYDQKHLVLNYALKNHCVKKKYSCIDIASSFEGKQDYWYDNVHTTPLGSKIIADKIYLPLKQMLK